MRSKQHLIWLISCVPYLVLMFFFESADIFLLKILPIGLLAFWVLKHPINAQSWVVGALCFSAIGDTFLALSHERYFIHGLGAFLIAHLFYIAVYLKTGVVAAWFTNKLTLSIIGIAALFALFIIPASGELWPALVIYISIISIMTMLAANLSKQSLPVFLGAACFMLSDSIIAINKFLFTVPLASLAIMVTYYLAQGLIIHGLLQLNNDNSPKAVTA